MKPAGRPIRKLWIVYGSNNNRISGKSADAHQLPGTRSSSRELLFEIRGVLLDEFLLVLWYVLKGMYRVGGASRHTQTHRHRSQYSLQDQRTSEWKPQSQARPAGDGCNRLGRPQRRGVFHESVIA